MIELRPYSDADFALTEAMECDPVVMKELGGPMPRAEMPRIHRRRLEFAEQGGWWFTILSDGQAAGTIGLWDRTWDGEMIVEMGWTLLPAFHGRGLASEAARTVIERARLEKKCSAIHAFPGVTNVPSNAICRKAGFVKLEEADIDYAGRPFRCHHWRLAL